jgi:hypothetical protein
MVTRLAAGYNTSTRRQKLETGSISDPGEVNYEYRKEMEHG